MSPAGRYPQVSGIRMLFSGFLAVLLAGLGLFVRSESAHDAFHVKHEPHAHTHHHHGHGHSHDHHHDHPGHPVPHEHSSPLIDLLAEEHLLSGILTVAPTHEVSVEKCELPARASFVTPSVAISQPPGRAPPICLHS